MTNGIDSSGSATVVDWADPDLTNRCKPGPSGYYWRNWPQTFGYVTPHRFYPRTVREISQAIQVATRLNLPIKAVGGGWSFSDASLPMQTQPEVDTVSILKRGADGAEDLSHVLQGLNGVTNSPVDLQPENVTGDLAGSEHYAQLDVAQITDSGANSISLPTPVSSTLAVWPRACKTSCTQSSQTQRVRLWRQGRVGLRLLPTIFTWKPV